MKVDSLRLASAALLVAAAATVSAQKTLRPPAVPLVACDPYFSIWSRADKLTDVPTSHWTGTRQQLLSTVVVDGRAYRLMGTGAAPALPQESVKVTPTRSIYAFKGAGVAVTLTFMTPALPNDIDILARPVTYLTWDVRSTDGKAHGVRLGYGNTGEPVVDEPSQVVRWERVQIGDLNGYKLGTVDQPVLQKTGDSRRIDWGYMYAVGGKGWTGAVPAKATAPASDPQVGWLYRDFGRVQKASANVILAYDDLYGMQYFTENLRPYWRRSGMDAAGLLRASASEYAALTKRCVAFDNELTADMKKSGGDRYAALSALAYRQTWAGSKIVADRNGQPLLLPKENSSNGCVGTVDIIFPMAPQVLLFGPSLTKALLVSNLDYASSGYWKWPFAPHDIGHVPKGERAGLRRRRADGGEPDAGRGVGEHADPHPRPGADGGEREVRGEVLADPHAVGAVPAKGGLRPGEPAFDGRLHGPPRAPDEPVGQGDAGAWVVRGAGEDAREA